MCNHYKFKKLVLSIICGLNIAWAGNCGWNSKIMSDAFGNNDLEKAFDTRPYVDQQQLDNVVDYIINDTSILADFDAATATDGLDGLPRSGFERINREISLNRVKYASPNPKKSALKIATSTRGNGMYGRCLELSCVAAADLQTFPERFPGYKVYTFGLDEGTNHRLTLLSKSHYSLDDKINWSIEHNSDSYVVDLWGAQYENEIGFKNLLFAPSSMHYYTRHSYNAIIRAKIWP